MPSIPPSEIPSVMPNESPIDLSSIPYRVGIGHDTHRLEPGNSLRLGGVEIPFEYSMVGHSDADVLLHAVTDALLGTAALGDIGDLYPDHDPANKGIDSAIMLQAAATKLRQHGLQIVNLDCIVFAQKPKLSDYKASIAARIAEILELDPRQVGIKAKTGEGIGDVGQLRCIQAQCVALIARVN